MNWDSKTILMATGLLSDHVHALVVNIMCYYRAQYSRRIQYQSHLVKMKEPIVPYVARERFSNSYEHSCLTDFDNIDSVIQAMRNRTYK